MNKILLAFFLSFCIQLNAQINGSVVDDKNEPIIGASVRVLINGELSNVGTVTDFDGKWSLELYNFPVQVEVSSMGYSSKRKLIENSRSVIIRLNPDRNVLKEVSIVQQRLSEQQEKSALTVESMDALAIKESPSVSFYDHLGTLKGVDLTSASIGFKIINTRGFNSTSPVRSLQLIDGVDNQSPGLNFSLGNVSANFKKISMPFIKSSSLSIKELGAKI